MKEPLLWWMKLDTETQKLMPLPAFYLVHWFIALPIQLVLWAVLPKHKTKGWW